VQRNLPIAWTILYELTKLTKIQFENGIKGGVIRPRMKTKDAKAARAPQPRLTFLKVPVANATSLSRCLVPLAGNPLAGRRQK
jgi:hypothetical protein